jgi:hypothetical protein
LKKFRRDAVEPLRWLVAKAFFSAAVDSLFGEGAVFFDMRRATFN